MARDEDFQQQMLIKWSQQPSVRQRYPELKLLYHIPNERKCSAQEGARFKRMGVKSGVPDLVLPVSVGVHHGLYIEMKAPNGRVSETQKWWLKELTAQGYLAVVCYGWEQAVHSLEMYLEGKI